MSVTVLVPNARHDPFEVPKPIRAALFDLDGTIADSFKVQRAALIEVARMSGRSISEHRVDDVLHQGFPKFLSSLGLHSYRNAYDQSYLRHVSRGQLFEWALPLLRKLQDAGVPIGIVTHLSRRNAQALLRASGALELVAEMRAWGDFPQKPDPSGIKSILQAFGVSCTDAFYVGDSQDDMRAARDAHCLAIGVEWGADPLVKLKEAGADLTFSLGEELSSWVFGSEYFHARRCVSCPSHVYRSAEPHVPAEAQCEHRCNVILNSATGHRLACRTCADLLPDNGTCQTCAPRARAGLLYLDQVHAGWLYSEDSGVRAAILSYKGLNGRARPELALPLGRLFLPRAIAKAACFEGSRRDLLKHPLDGPLVPVPANADSTATRGFSAIHHLLMGFFAPLLADSVPALTKPSGDSHFIRDKTVSGSVILGMAWDEFKTAVNQASVNDDGDRWEIADVLENTGASMKDLSESDRKDNALTAFHSTAHASSPVRGRTVYLVDDVITTGWSMNACARLLKQAGATRVVGIALTKNYHLRRDGPNYLCPRCRNRLRRYTNNIDGSVFYRCERWQFRDPNSCQFKCNDYDVDQYRQA